MENRTFYYARVSSREQNLDRQLAVFASMGASERDIITDKERGKDGKGKVFAPIEPSIYTGKGSTQPNITAFMTKTGLKTQVANGIFFKFIASGTGSQLVDQMLFEQQRTTPNDITHDNTVQ